MQSNLQLFNLLRSLEVARLNGIPYVPYDLEETKSLTYNALLDQLPVYKNPPPGWQVLCRITPSSQLEFDECLALEPYEYGLMRDPKIECCFVVLVKV